MTVTNTTIYLHSSKLNKFEAYSVQKLWTQRILSFDNFDLSVQRNTSIGFKKWREILITILVHQIIYVTQHLYHKVKIKCLGDNRLL